jgi:hypothetical protein
MAQALHKLSFGAGWREAVAGYEMAFGVEDPYLHSSLYCQTPLWWAAGTDTIQ